MSGRGLFVLLGLFAVAIAVVVFTDRAPEDEKKSETLETLVPIKLEGIGALEREGSNDVLRLEREGESGWRLARPIQAEADPRQVKSLFDTALQARIRRVVEEKAADLKPYGLDPPEMRLRVHPRSDAMATLEIALGRTSPVGSGRYVGTGGGKVVLADGLAGGTLEQDAGAFVEKRLFPLAPEDIRKISLERTAGRLTLVREGLDWRLEAPVADAADSSSVDTLARSLAELSFSMLLEGPDELEARAGTARSGVRAHVEAATKHQRLEASLASTGPGEDRYACRLNGRCGLVPGSALRDLERASDDFRDRRLSTASAEEIRQVRVKSAGSEILLARTDAGKGPGRWSVREGNGPVLSADSGRVDGLLDRLRWLRASTFEESSPTLRLRDTVILAGDKGELGRLELSGEPHDVLGEGGEPPQKRLYARSSWRPGILFTIPWDGIGTLPRSAADLTPQPPEGGPSGGTP